VARLRYLLFDHALRVTLEVTNTGKAPLPFGLGLHPWLERRPGVTLRAPARGTWTRGPLGLPEESIAVPPEWDFTSARALPSNQVDHVFRGWDGRAEVHWPDTGVSLAIEADMDYYILYTPGRQGLLLLRAGRPCDQCAQPAGWRGAQRPDGARPRPDAQPPRELSRARRLPEGTLMTSLHLKLVVAALGAVFSVAGAAQTAPAPESYTAETTYAKLAPKYPFIRIAGSEVPASVEALRGISPTCATAGAICSSTSTCRRRGQARRSPASCSSTAAAGARACARTSRRWRSAWPNAAMRRPRSATGFRPRRHTRPRSTT
jgi:hypothetical protein